MGTICATAVARSTEPDIQIDLEQLHALIATHIDEIPDKIRLNCERFPIEIQNCDPNGYCVPDTSIKLDKNTPDEQIAIASIIAAFGASTRNAIKNDVWKEIEPQINEQLSSNLEASDKSKTSAKQTFRQNVINKEIDNELDKALEKMKSN